MIPIDTIVSIKSGDEYGGKYTGKLGIIKKFTDDRVGVEFVGLKNHASKYGLFWFKKENVTPSLFDAPKRNDAIIPAALAKAFLNLTSGAPRASLGVKQVIFSGPKTIVFWLDGTKTIVSCGEGDHNDPYAGFCAAVTKRVFGSTSQAKKVLARTRFFAIGERPVISITTEVSFPKSISAYSIVTLFPIPVIASSARQNASP